MNKGLWNYAVKASEFSEAVDFYLDVLDGTMLYGGDILGCKYQLIELGVSRIIVFDNVWPIMPFYRPLAWLLRKLDRGKWVRTENELLKLANSAYPMKWQSKRFTYSYTGLEGLFLTVQKTEIPMQV